MGRISNKGIFDGASDSDSEIKTENQYAKNYDVWRKKEELNKLKTKYGEDALDHGESSSSSDDDDEAVELTQEVEKDFYKTLACLKKKDPKIYDNNVTFFQAKYDKTKTEKKPKDRPMYLKDYERKLLLEKGGIISDEEDEVKSRSRTYAEDQQQLKDEIIKEANFDDDDNVDDEKAGGLLELRQQQKTKEENEKESEYLQWLTGQNEELKDDKIKTELKPLKDFWNDPNLDNEEKFLRDYVLKKRYLENDNEDYIPTYEEIVHDSDNSLSGDEEEIEKQEEFEHKYNFRFEEPDQEFIKRYPRTVEHSLRKTDDRRKLKRAETKERKLKEKEEKMADIKKMQELKRKEIEEKIEKLREVTGATDLAFHDEDIDGDFDPEAHDKRMQELFNDNFYEGDETDQKPEFPDLDEELEIENWDRWNGEDTNEEQGHEMHCEDGNFNMDADYDPTTSLKEELIENSKGRKKRRRKSKVAEALSRPKPKYDPNDKTYEKYFDEYYKLDCEDIIGDIPCRFKYREVLPNDFGLTTEEILMAKDKELNRWCSIKKAIQRRPDNIEKYDQIAYAKKANNVGLKKKLLPSLFLEEPVDAENNQPSTSNEASVAKEMKDEAEQKPLIGKKNSKKKNVAAEMKEETAIQQVEDKIESPPMCSKSKIIPEKVKKEEAMDDIEHKTNGGSSETTNQKRKKKNKKKKKKKANVDNNQSKNSQEKVKVEAAETNSSNTINKKNGKKRKRVDADNNTKNPGGKRMKKDAKIAISDSRLTAFGINPKKFKNKLKYGNKNKN
ncbi:unnamed protein product [Ceutorhynchus assimilis]|uniref:Protein KRI1 homolog n=1 Tax=Ceutorhynchus assimilis TaxID=467358 RepID=A0A9N9MGL4_9CUCU|nr:unnamed protein product [Ceutorhynchus assimilis]